MVRSPDDPDRRPRPVGGQEDKTPHLTFRKMQPHDVVDVIMELLDDGKPRTLNAISVSIWDKTADITSGTIVEEMLWRLVEDRRIEFTMEAPVLFRRRRKRRRKGE